MMPGELPFFIEGSLVDIMQASQIGVVKVSNGNVYHLHSHTRGIDFQDLKIGQLVKMEVTQQLTRVLSASIISE